MKNLLRVLRSKEGPATPPDARPIAHGTRRSRRPRILVAEDNPTNQRVITAMLESEGHRADIARNGSEAIEAVRARRYDVVLMDIQMPGVDGLEASREIAALLGPDRPRIVALTASATADDRRKCLQAGMDDYVTKPTTPSRLLEVIERAAACG